MTGDGDLTQDINFLFDTDEEKIENFTRFYDYNLDYYVIVGPDWNSDKFKNELVQALNDFKMDQEIYLVIVLKQEQINHDEIDEKIANLQKMFPFRKTLVFAKPDFFRDKPNFKELNV